MAATENAEAQADRPPEPSHADIIAAVYDLARAEKAFDDAIAAREAADEHWRACGNAKTTAEISLRHLRRMMVPS